MVRLSWDWVRDFMELVSEGFFLLFLGWIWFLCFSYVIFEFIFVIYLLLKERYKWKFLDVLIRVKFGFYDLI